MSDQVPSGGSVVARLIDVGDISPLRAQTLHHGIADAMVPGDAPVVVMADPLAPFISVGVHQDVAREVDLQSCVQTNTPIIRREIGGPAAVLSAGDMLVHVVLPRGRPEAASAASGLYARFTEPVIRTWRSFGLPVELGPWGAIHLDRYRVTRLHAGLIGHAVVVGGSIVRHFDPDIIAQRAGLPSDRLREQMRDTIRQHLARATNRPADRTAIKEALLGHIGDVLGWRLEPAAPTDAELEAIGRRETQMADAAHVYAGGQRMARAELRAIGGLALVDIVHHGAAGMVRLRLLERAGVIEDLQITGELTALPADGLERLAARLVGLRRDAPDLATRIQVQLGLLGIEVPGVTAVDLATALRPVVRPAGIDPLDLLFGGAAQE
jgi:lipoate-protein ligase A